MKSGDPYQDEQRRDEERQHHEAFCEQLDRFGTPGEDWWEAKERMAREAEEAKKKAEEAE